MKTIIYTIVSTLITSISPTISHALPSNEIIQNNIGKPNKAYDTYIHEDHPLTTDELHSEKGKPSLKSGTATHTFVRCYYRKSNNIALPATSYEWAINKDDSYYKLPGYWHNDGFFAWRNMFYTEVSQYHIQSICNATLTKYGKNTSFEIKAANNSMSYDHAIWTNDDKVEINRNHVTKIISFGDSLTDIDNLYNASLWMAPNAKSWFHGRFSNGFGWVEYLAQQYKLPVYNWAIGGAGGKKLYFDGLFPIPGLLQQIDSWAEYMQSAKNYKASNTLFTILIGANDFVNYNRSVEMIVNDLYNSVEKLIIYGGKNILILNLPNLTAAPRLAGYNENEKRIILAKVIEYNNQLNKLVQDLNIKYSGQINVHIFNNYALFNNMIQNADKYGFINTRETCLDVAADDYFVEERSLRRSCTNPNQFMFWDAGHLTTKGNEIMGKQVAESIKDQYNWNH